MAAYTGICSKCGQTGLRRYFSLCRNVEVNVEIDENHIETDIKQCDGIGEWCESCGREAAIAHLKSMGIQPVEAETDPPDGPCSKCGQRVVPNFEPHVAYTVTLDECRSIEEMLIVSPVCDHCEPTGRN